MKALITGGAGFIGSHLAEAICHRGGKAIVLDDLSEGKLANLAWGKNRDSLEFVKGSAGDQKLLRQLLPGCECVFHHAALTSVPRSIADPLASHASNLSATVQLLCEAREAGIRRFFFASSAAIYGENKMSPCQETAPPAPKSPYALQKYTGEKYCQLFHQLYGLETTCFRYFNVFGPRQSSTSPYSGVIARFCDAAVKGESPTIYGDGWQTRDFVYVDNVVAANLLAAEASSTQVAGRILNVASGQSVALLEVVRELNRLTRQSLTPKFEAPRMGEVTYSAADLTAIRQALGFTVKVAWQEGLARTLEHHRAFPEERGPK